MKTKLLPLIGLLTIISFFIYQNFDCCPKQPTVFEAGEDLTKPDDWMFNMRAYPHNHIDIPSFRNAVKQRKKAKQAALRSSGEWESVGPDNIGGRITDLALHPTNTNIIYAGSAVGGIFKTIDGGATWYPVFDDANSASIGNIALAPSNPDIVYVGTGEANGSATSGAFFGDGMYKSLDGGDTWDHVGLDNSQHIGRVVVDPQNANRVYVAVAGLLYGNSPDRGLYRTLDGGQNWEQVLFVSDSTSCIDVVINPQNADIVYAAMWERTRFPWFRDYGGVTSGIWRSTNGGQSWEQLTNGLPANSVETGRIGLAIAPSDPNILYASYTTDQSTNVFNGIYKSVDAGDTWTLVNSDITDVYASFGWYFGNVRVNPINAEDVYVLGQQLVHSFSGGNSFFGATEDMHVDFHALEYHPLNPNMIVVGNDGGVYISQDGGNYYTHIETIPNNQFYNCELDESFPNRYYGGTQDNGSMRTLTGNTNDYERILGGDGFHVNVNPVDNNYVYAEFQWGNLFRSTDGGFDFDWAMEGIDPDDRTNWNTPVILDHSNPSNLYYGSDKLYRTIDHAENWFPISDDLTNGPVIGSSSYATITTIAIAPTDNNYLLVGTDDSNVQISMNGGGDWELVSGDLPNRSVSQVAFDPENPNICYVAFSGYRFVDYLPHLFRSTDAGQNWTDISGNLPEVPINDVIIDPENLNTLFVANDIGIYISQDLGTNWEPLGDNLPLTVVADLRLHNPTRKLLAGTFGRSMYTFDLNQVISSTTKQELSKNSLNIFPNPVLSEATISFTFSESATATLQVLDLQGRTIELISEQNFPAGQNKMIWNKKQLTSGMYILRLQTDHQIMTKQIVVQ